MTCTQYCVTLFRNARRNLTIATQKLIPEVTLVVRGKFRFDSGQRRHQGLEIFHCLVISSARMACCSSVIDRALLPFVMTGPARSLVHVATLEVRGFWI